MKSSGGSMGTSPTVLLAMLVAGLAATATAAAARPCDTDAIRLPSSGGGGAGGRPWECCDIIVRDPIFRPPRWQCNDVVAECSANCHQCEEAPGGGGYICRDWITSLFEPPVCTPRPWDCCDNAVCTRQYIPYCQCADKVESCPSNCKECGQVESDPPRYRCLDQFHGYPGPKCTPWISKGN
ncbi:Bowman-Birk type bran trypsin inhibitor [Dichanthelium oligosanthes]|uniref:Bowman-Birk type bran trypsin inhibitor n=1 Tax=Dichanthelium oligosanthes TaxID=888268 RepID=A0A1E5WMB2_9POAL|nr:Bowman-Birk type bran trypsin inhibitor [Dichanthelium oligosanthes]